MQAAPTQIEISRQVWVCDACGCQDNKSCGCQSSAHSEELAKKKEQDRKRAKSYRASRDATVDNVREFRGEFKAMNEFQWRTVAVIIRNRLELTRPVTSIRARKIVAQLINGQLHDPELLSKINDVRFADSRKILADAQFGVGA
jgi:hypothetical protein